MEDSELDLGLLDSVIRNMPRMMEILEDYLSWHLEKLGEEAAEEKRQGRRRNQKRQKIPTGRTLPFGGEKVSSHLKLSEVRGIIKSAAAKKIH